MPAEDFSRTDVSLFGAMSRGSRSASRVGCDQTVYSLAMHWGMAWALILLLPCPALRALEGRLLFPDGTPVAGAQVTILEHPGQSRTDREGRFRWSPDPPVPFEVRVELPGGHDTLHIVVREAVPEGTLEMVVRPLFREDLTVTAGVPIRTGTTPANALDLVTQEELAQSRPSRLIDAIEGIPGVGRISAGHAGVPSIRGLARGRTLILLNGSRVISERRVGPGASYLDPFFLDRVEVVRGPGSVAYGSDAFGGVIHALTRKPDPESDYGARFLGSLGYGMPEQSAGLELSRSLESGSVFFLGSLRNYGDYRSSGVTVDNSSARNRSFLTGAQFQSGAGELSLGWQTDRGHDLGRPTLRSPQMRTFYPDESSDRMNLAFEPRPVAGFDRIRIEGSMGRYALITDRERLPSPDQERELQRSRVSARHFDLRVQAVSPLEWTRLEVGFDVNGRFGLHSENTTRDFDAGNRPTGTHVAASIEDASRIVLAPFLSAEVAVNSFLSFWAGGRWDQVSSTSRGSLGDFNRIGRALSGYLAIVARPLPPLQLTAQLSRGFREPTLSDRYFQGVSGRGLVHGNPNLAPETSRQWDVSARWSGNDWRWDLFLYRYEIRQSGGALRSPTWQVLLSQPRSGPLEWSGNGAAPPIRRGAVRGAGRTRCQGPDPRRREPAGRHPRPRAHADRRKNSGFAEPPPAPWPHLFPGLQSRPHGGAHSGLRHLGSLLELAVGLTNPAPVPGQEPHRQGLPGQPRPLVGTGPGPQPASDPDVQPQ